MIAAFSQSSSQKSRGTMALCWLGVPSRRLQRLNLLRCDRQPSDQEQHRKAGAAGPVSDEMDNQITGRLGNPPSVQSSPSSFFSLTCSSISSESTSCLRWSFCSRKAIFLSLPSLRPRENDARMRRCRSRRTLSASGRTSSDGSRVCHTGRRQECFPGGEVEEWRPFPGT